MYQWQIGTILTFGCILFTLSRKTLENVMKLYFQFLFSTRGTDSCIGKYDTSNRWHLWCNLIGTNKAKTMWDTVVWRTRQHGKPIPLSLIDSITDPGCHYMLQTVSKLSNNLLQWRHNGRDSVSHHQPHDCLLNRLFTRRTEKTSKLRVTGLCAGNSPMTGEFPAQMARKMFPFDDVIM